MASTDDALRRYYEQDREQDRLAEGPGLVEYLRTTSLLSQVLPTPPATVADIGGGPGRYSSWLVDLGHRVHHRDLMAQHVAQVRAAHPLGSSGGDRLDAAVGDARNLDLGDASVDAVLLLGPLYHLPESSERHRALSEARRIVRPGGPVVVAAITRWAARLDGLRKDVEMTSEVAALLDTVEQSGVLEPFRAGSFNGYFHTPEGLRSELDGAGLALDRLVGLEGPAPFLGDLEERLADPERRARLLSDLAKLESVPDLLGVSPHLLALTHRPIG